MDKLESQLLNTMTESTSSTQSLKIDEQHIYEEIRIEFKEQLNKVCEDIEKLKQTVANNTTHMPEKIDSKSINEHGIRAISSKLQNEHNRYKTMSDTRQQQIADSNDLLAVVSEGNSSEATKYEGESKMKEKPSTLRKFKNRCLKALHHFKNTTNSHNSNENACANCAEKVALYEEVTSNKNDEIKNSSSASVQNDHNFHAYDGISFPSGMQEQTTNRNKEENESPLFNTAASIMANTSVIPVKENGTYPNEQPTSLKHEGSELNILQENVSIPKASDYSVEVIRKEKISVDNPKRKNIKLIVFGCSGNGKSSTINTLMDISRINTGSQMLKTEKKPILISTLVNDFKLSCVDTPGIEENKSLSHLETIYESLDLFNYSFSAMLFVFKYGDRFTQQSKSIVKSLKGILGERVIKEYCICVMTHGEQFVDEMKETNKKSTFQEWCKKHDSEVEMFFRECQYRCVLFDNKTRDELKIKSQFDELLSTVNKLKIYQKSDFESITAEREKFMIESRMPEITKKANEKISLLRAKLLTIEAIQCDDEKIKSLNSLLLEVENLKLGLPSQAKDINSTLDGFRLEIDSKLNVIELNQHLKTKM